MTTISHSPHGKPVPSYDFLDDTNHYVRHFKLDEHGEPVPVKDVIGWAEEFEKQDRVVAKDEILGHEVSTVFLGFDHGYDKSNPLVWETMVFGPTELDNMVDRCGGPRANAVEMHKRMLEEMPVMVAKARLTQ